MTMDLLNRDLPTIQKEELKPLRLNIQFFADPAKDPDLDPDDKDELLTLKDMFKKYPHLRVEHKQRMTDAVNERFKSYDFDPEEAKTALAEKKQREESGDTVEVAKTQLTNEFKSKEEKYLARIKGLAVEAYAAKDGLDPKLISKLAAEQVGKLALDESLKLKAEDLDDIIEELRTEFPTAFPVVETVDPDPANAAITPVKKMVIPGSKQQTNPPPPKGDENVEAEMAAILENINRRSGKKPKE